MFAYKQYNRKHSRQYKPLPTLTMLADTSSHPLLGFPVVGFPNAGHGP